MELKNIVSLKAVPRALLEVANWTVERLATTTETELSKVKGIGSKTAGKIIVEARDLVNQIAFEKPELSGLAAPSVEVKIEMSPRVRRAIMSSDRNENL